MVNQQPCENTGTNLVPTKPSTTTALTSLFGTPKGEAGRRNFAIQGIVLHCVDQTIAQYDACQLVGASPPDGTPHGSMHYMVSNSGLVHQYVDDANLSWGFDAYNLPIYATPATLNGIVWNTLVTANGNVSPDYYVINIALESGLPIGANGCYICPGPTVLQDAGCQALVQLLAYLSTAYNIPLTTEYIQFHQKIDCNATKECACCDTDALLLLVQQYCEPCVAPVQAGVPDLGPMDTLAALVGKTTQNCCDDNGCQVCIPVDTFPCIIGSQITEGEIERFVGVQIIDGVQCLVMDDFVVDPATPLMGGGTTTNPLSLDLCAYGDWIPDGDIVLIVGIDGSGCLVDSPAGEVVIDNETPITVIDTLSVDLTASGTNNHTIQADVIIDPVEGNQLEVGPDGLSVILDNCELGEYVPVGDIAVPVGLDASGCLVADLTSIQDALCDLPGTGIAPVRILADDGVDCPVWTTPSSIVSVGLDVVDTDTIDLTETFIDGNTPVQLSGVVNLAGPQGGIDNTIVVVPGEGLYSPEVTVVDSDCINLSVSPTNVVTADLIVSPAIGGVGNALQCTATGVYVPVGGGITVADTNCMDLNITLGGVITASPIISGSQGGIDNIIICTPQGLYAPDTSLTPVDTDCVDITINAGSISADLIISGAIGGINNSVQCTATGVYVPVGAGLVFNDTNCISLDETNGIVTAIPVISGSQGGVSNALTCTAQGLYVPIGSGIGVLDTDCIDLSLTNGVISADVVISPVAQNAVSCSVQGLFIQSDSLVPGSITAAGTQVFTHTDNLGNSVDFCEAFDTISSANDCVTGVGSDYVIKSLFVSSKTLVVESEPTRYTVQSSLVFPSTSAPVVPAVLPSVGTIVDTIISSITNPSNCRDMLVTIVYEGSALSTQNQSATGGTGRIGTYTETTINNGVSWFASTPAQQDSIVTVLANDAVYEIWRPTLVQTHVIGPGVTLDWGIRVRVGEPDGVVSVGQNIVDGFQARAIGVSI